MLISDDYRRLNRELHETNPHYGNDNFGWSRFAKQLVQGGGYLTVLDYGAGKGNLKIALSDLPVSVQEYDPAIEGKDGEPEPAELVVCTDVLEHIEPENLNAVLRHLRELTQKRLFVTISTRLAGKTLADGRNAHLLVKPPVWWRAKLLKYFQILLWEERGATVAAELVAKKHMGARKSAGRRQMTPEMVAFFEHTRQQINAASDAFSQVGDVRTWESVGDEPADFQAAVDVIEHMDDMDAALADLASKSKKCTFVGVRITELHSEWDWRRVLEKRFRAAQWERQGEHLMMIGAPCVMVQGVTAVGAVDSEERWKAVVANSARFPRRIETAEPHGRTALIACYGPSLVDTIETLKIEAQRPDVDVVSVSGSHDFLLSHGITPKFHIECDPRLHKADNIERPHPEVQYLVASVCHPGYFDKLGNADIRLWHVSTGEHVLRIIGDLKESPKHVISGGGSVGLRSIPLLYAMGYRDLSIFAMDCSFKSEGETIQQWAGKHAGKKQDVVDVMCDGEIFISSPVLLTYATNFFETVQKVTDLNVRLYGHGLLQSMCRFYMREPSQENAFMERIEHVDDALTERVA
ncbi:MULTISPECIES: 6-hydroxymethylpterin diphosphokinase MptE-like protein [Rhodomicrobium]|uniref:6-hydroxymethylpterin diphosphokinase MptE-like protein n=1 Tax=Rhodomicrobium TaxID=1068 RepID=UPI000B4AD468|nr:MULTISPECIES: 6-hydroxymethylpterin diphosphokinase MptE-like protein [Rhodomicrobium]